MTFKVCQRFHWETRCQDLSPLALWPGTLQQPGLGRSLMGYSQT